MRIARYVTLLFAVLGLGFGSTARAQNTTCTGSGTVSPSTSWSLSILNSGATGMSDSDFVTVAPTAIENVLDIAECQCEAGDIYLRALVTAGISSTIPPQFSVWAGSACNVTTNRSTMCEQVSDAVSINTFLKGSSAGKPSQPISVRALVAPKTTSGSTTAHQCVMGQVQNSMWFLYGDPNNPEYCNIELDYYGTPPVAPTSPTAGSGDEAITISWVGPQQGSVNLPDRYQVLCAQEDGTPCPGAGAYAFGESANGLHKLSYSTCVKPYDDNTGTAGTIQRQVLATSGTVTTGDMGTTTTSTDLASAIAPDPQQVTGSSPLAQQGEPLGTQADPADGGTTATGICDTSDGGVGEGYFATLDKKYVVTEPLSSTSTSVRISALSNNTVYYFMIVAVDKYGNPAPSPVICGKPQPVEDLYRRFRADGGMAQGFCFIATAAFGSYESPFVMALRDFRDQVLAPTETGASFIAWYYRTSPPIADWIRPRPWARFAVRMALWPVITFAVLWLEIGPGEIILLGGLLFALAYARRLRKTSGAAQASTSSTAPAHRPASEALTAAGSQA